MNYDKFQFVEQLEKFEVYGGLYMKRKGILGIIVGVIGIILGITIIIISVTEIEVPKLIWFLFTVICLVNAIGNIVNYKRIKNSNTKRSEE